MDTDRVMAVILSIIAILFGIVALAMPGLVFDAFIVIIGIILLVLGILTAGMALSVPVSEGYAKTILLGSGLFSIVIGLLALLTPFIATIAIAYLIAIWLVINGLLTVAYAFSIKWEKHRILSGLAGIIALLIGLFLFVSPLAGVELLILVVGIFFVIMGIVSLLMTAVYWKK